LRVIATRGPPEDDWRYIGGGSPGRVTSRGSGASVVGAVVPLAGRHPPASNTPRTTHARTNIPAPYQTLAALDILPAPPYSRSVPLTCHAVVVRSQSVDALLPWPHWRGALPSDERLPGFVAPTDDPSHPFRTGEFHRHMRLHGDLDDLELGTVMAALCLYNDVAHEPADDDNDDNDDPPVSPSATAILERLLAREALIVAGGLQLNIDDQQILAPQCCCGLETWREWLAFASGGDPPWSGHSPDPHLDRLPSGLLEIGYDSAIHTIDPADLRAALDETTRTLAAFADRLTTWLTAAAPDLAPALTAKLAADLALR